MKNPDYQRENLKQAAFEMLLLCKNQLFKATDAFVSNDTDLAEEVVHRENRVNALDLKIERDCERYLALYNPVATDLRYIMSLLKINYNLERIGDHAFDIANHTIDFVNPINPELLEKVQFEKMVFTVESMYEDVVEAFEEEEPKIARKVFKKDKTLNKINHQAKNILGEEIRNNKEVTDDALFIFAVLKKLERTGDLLKNISEGIIFYLEAEVLTHKKKK